MKDVSSKHTSRDKCQDVKMDEENIELGLPFCCLPTEMPTYDDSRYATWKDYGNRSSIFCQFNSMMAKMESILLTSAMWMRTKWCAPRSKCRYKQLNRFDSKKRKIIFFRIFFFILFLMRCRVVCRSAFVKVFR